MEEEELIEVVRSSVPLERLRSLAERGPGDLVAYFLASAMAARQGR